MYYLIHTSHHQRPYLSTVSFIANDFAQWGCRVTCHAKDSPYINEIRFQEKRTRPATRRIELMEVWAKEVLTRKQQARSYRSLPEFETRKDRASNFVQDFICALSSFESPVVAPAALQNDPLPLPAYPHALVAKYTRLLQRCAYTSYATLPPWADPSVFYADQVVLAFRVEKCLKRAQLSHALDEAIRRGTGRMAKLEQFDERGVTKVLMWVNVGDLVARELSAAKGELEDPVPMYEKGEWVWPPGYVECAALERGDCRSAV